MSDDLTALVFELQRAPTPADKAKALARAWRTVRGLKPAERRLLAREVGFDGAEELIEGLGGSERGIFAPAAILEALGKVRTDPDFSVRRVLKDLKDPDRRDDLLMRGMDLVASSMTGSDEFTLDPLTEDEESPLHDEALMPDEDGGKAAAGATTEVRRRVRAVPPVPGPEPPPPPWPEPQPEPAPEPRPEPQLKTEPAPEPIPRPEPESEREREQQIPPDSEWPSPWDSLGALDESGASVEAVVAPGLMTMLPTDRSQRPSETVEGSAILRLRELREEIPGLGGASVAALTDRLASFPEPWARRRALVALIQAGVPDDPSRALDLIADLDRPLDRRWCLSALARRGDLMGGDLERALSMLTSPAARRRVAGLAAV